MSYQSPQVSFCPAQLDLTFVVPFVDECASIEALYAGIVQNCETLGRSFQIIFVDDGSRDGGDLVVRELASKDARVEFIQFRRNFGKSAALSAGFAAARASMVITMDADLQDDPAELSRFVEAIEAGADVVSGWKQIRHDPVDKKLPSKLFNAAVNRSFGLRLHDHNCGFKAYRAEALAELNLYGELHRFIPALLFARGFKIVELPVEHHPRRFGQSKFGAGRLIKGGLDLLTVSLTTRYVARPLHLFGGAGLGIATLGAAILTYLTVLWFAGAGPIGQRPLLTFGILMVLFGSQLVGTGLLGELLLSRTIREQDKYAIKYDSATKPRLETANDAHHIPAARIASRQLAVAENAYSLSHYPAFSANTVSPFSLTSAKPPST